MHAGDYSTQQVCSLKHAGIDEIDHAPVCALTVLDVAPRRTTVSEQTQCAICV